MALSANKKEIAICEKAENAVCVIYEMSTLKRKKVLCSSDYDSTSFTAVAFAKSSEKLN
jgi:cilia- and flagella-associated protein 57